MSKTTTMPILAGILFLFMTASLGLAGDPVVALRLPHEPASLDWTLGDVPIHVINNSNEGLYRLDATGHLLADEAEAMHVPVQPMGTWRIRLKPALAWSDGRPVKADDYVDAFRRLTDPRTGSTYSYLLADFESFRAVSERELEVRLRNHGTPNFPVSVLTHWATFPIRADLIAANPKGWGTDPKAMAFNGPYRIESYQHESRITLVPNARHRAPGTLKRVDALIIVDDSTALRLYDAGRLHFLPEINSIEREGLSKRPDYHTMRSPILTYVGVDVRNPALASKESRRALSAAVNRALFPKLLAMNCVPAGEPIPGGGPGPLPSPADHAVLKGKRLEFGFYEKGLNRSVSEYLQESWRKALGLTVTLESNEVKGYWTRLAEKPYPLFLNSFAPPVPNPVFYYRLFATGNPMNMGRWTDPAYDRALAAGNLRAAREILKDQVPVIPLYFRAYDYLLSPRLSGAVLNSMTSLDLSRARLAD